MGPVLQDQHTISLDPSSFSACITAGCGMQAARPESEWLLCLDDDVMVHPGTLQQLAQGMQLQAAFMATGQSCRQALCKPGSLC